MERQFTEQELIRREKAEKLREAGDRKSVV